MTLAEVEALITSVKSQADDGDYEGAHSAEDSLLLGVLHAIANGAENAKELAAKAIKVRDLEHPRWYA